MNEFVLTLISMSATGSVLALLTMGAKRLFGDRLPSSLLYYVWIIVLLRLILPFSSEHSLLNMVYSWMEDAARSSVSLDAVFATVSSEDGSIPLRISFIDRNSSGLVGFVMDNALWIWLTGAVVYLVCTLGSYRRYCQGLISSSKPASEGDSSLLCGMGGERVELLYCPRAESPMLIGLIRPRIVLPEYGYCENGHEQELRNILLHELTHYRRGDLLLKRIVTFIAAAHWFNPVIYLMGREINLCGELSCDEGAVRNLDESGRMSYGYTLIMTAAGVKFGSLYAAFASRKATLRERILRVRSGKKRTGTAVCLGTAIVALLTAAALFIGVVTPAQRPTESPIDGISYNTYEQYMAIVDSLHYSSYDSLRECFGSYEQFEEYFSHYLRHEDFEYGNANSVGEEFYIEALFAECCYRAVLIDYRTKQYENQYGETAAAAARQMSDDMWTYLSLSEERFHLQSAYTFSDEVIRQTLRYMY